MDRDTLKRAGPASPRLVPAASEGASISMGPSQPRILLVDHRGRTRARWRRVLERDFPDVVLKDADSPQAAAGQAAQMAADAILLGDAALAPGPWGAWSALRAAAPRAALLLVAGRASALTSASGLADLVLPTHSVRHWLGPVLALEIEASRLRHSTASVMRGGEARERLFRFLLSGVCGPTFAFRLTAEGVPGPFVGANRVAGELLGCASARLVGRCLLDLVPPDQHGIVVAALARLADSGRVRFDLDRMPLRRGSLPVEVQAAARTFGTVTQVALVCRPAEAYAAQPFDGVCSVAALRATLEATADGLLLIDRTQRIFHFNRRLLDLWRIPQPPDAHGAATRMDALLLGRVRNPTALAGCLQESAAEEIESVLELKDGRVLECRSVPLRLQGEATGSVLSFRDITDQRRPDIAP